VLAARTAARGGAADIERQQHVELALFFVGLDVNLAAARAGLPVYALDLVSGLVLAQIGEEHAASAEGRAIAAEQIRVHHAPGAQLDAPELLNQAGVEQRFEGA